MGKKKKNMIKAAVWYAFVAADILLFLYAFLRFDLAASLAAFVLAMLLSKHKEEVPLPSRWKGERKDIYR